MPRPKKCRRVCRFPQNLVFIPKDGDRDRVAVVLTVDEYETLRLIDKEGMSQEQCSEFMQVARGTVQQMYKNARRKLADMLVDGLPLRIEGGDYRLCDGNGHPCSCMTCFKQKIDSMYAKTKGDAVMRVAVTYENGMVFQHFGHSEAFKLYEVEGGEVKSSEVVPTNGSGHGALAGFLRERGVEVLICGGIGAGAQNALAEAGIKLYGGVSGSADSAVQALIEGNLSYNPDVMCDHHGEDHHGDHENCGGHGEGHDSCGGHCGH